MDRPGIRRLRFGMRYQLDRTARKLDVSVAGLFATHTIFREGFGCVRVLGGKEPYLLKADIVALKTPKTPPLLPEIAGPDVVEPSDPALKAALDHAFEEPAEPPLRRTKAVVVVRDGRVIAERYAPGIGIDTPLPSFSMTKSLVNALLGIMTQQGLTSPSLPAPIPEWHGAGDPRREIEVGHLMRMTSGLALDETDDPLNPSEQMFAHDDMAAFAVKAPLIAAPGTRWAYSSATTQILARIIREAVGGPEQSLAYAWRELFNPLGMRNVTLEFDGSGTLQGANNMLASARDWARFGLLYLNDGKIGDKRILHHGMGGLHHLGHAGYGLCRGLLDQQQRASQRARPRARRHSSRCLLCVRQSRPALRDHSLAAHGGGAHGRQRRSHRRHARTGAADQGRDRGDGSLTINVRFRRSRHWRPTIRCE